VRVSGTGEERGESYPWLILSGALIVLGVAFIVLMKEPERAEI